jgi:hypothetical protein
MMSLRPVLSCALLLAGVALGVEHQAHPLDTKAPTPKGKSVELTLPDGKTSTAYVAHPKGPPRGGLLLLHE